jgi:hypothetical protein
MGVFLLFGCSFENILFNEDGSIKPLFTTLKTLYDKRIYQRKNIYIINIIKHGDRVKTIPVSKYFDDSAKSPVTSIRLAKANLDDVI